MLGAALGRAHCRRCGRDTTRQPAFERHVGPRSGAEFAEAHPTARFTGELVTSLRFDEEDAKGSGDLGSETTSKSRVQGEIESARRSRAVIDSGPDGVQESILIDQTVYDRYADTMEDLDATKFVTYELDKPSPGVVDYSSSANEFDIATMLAAASVPAKVSARSGRSPRSRRGSIRPRSWAPRSQRRSTR